MTLLIDADKYRDSLEESWKNCQEWQDGADTEEIRIRAEQAEITFMECILRLKEQPKVDAVPIEFIKSEIARMKEGLNPHHPECAIYAEDLGILIEEWEGSKKEYETD